VTSTSGVALHDHTFDIRVVEHEGPDLLSLLAREEQLLRARFRRFERVDDRIRIVALASTTRTFGASGPVGGAISCGRARRDSPDRVFHRLRWSDDAPAAPPPAHASTEGGAP
jgi:hypothetical protein